MKIQLHMYLHKYYTCSKSFYNEIFPKILQRKMDDFETITGKVNNAGNTVAPPSVGTPLGNWKENGTNNSPSPKHPGIFF